MVTTVSDGTATLDVEVYKVGRDSLVSGSDICSTGATDINSTTFADKEFVITPTGLSAGDMLDIRIAVAVNDAATGTAVDAAIAAAEALLSIRG